MSEDKDTTPPEFRLAPPLTARQAYLAKRNAYAKVYRERHKEAIAARKKAYRTPEMVRSYYARNKEACLASSERWKQANLDKVRVTSRARNLRKKYGLTPEQFDSMLKACDGRCQICKVVLSEITNESVCIDHDHQTGAVRGVICNRCNRMVGLAHDNPAILQQAARYLKKAALSLSPQRTL